MTIWTSEIKELERLYESLRGKFPEVEKELQSLINTDDENVALLYSRRCLEVIIADLCECELRKSRGTEPLKGIIDKLQKEEKVPSHIIASMHGLNTLSTFGTHPKDFDPEQVKPVLSNLLIIVKWYLGYKDPVTFSKLKVEEEKYRSGRTGILAKINQRVRKKTLLMISGLLLAVIITFVSLTIFNVIKFDSWTKGNKSIAVLPFTNLSNDTTQLYFSDGMVEEILDKLFKIGDLKVISRTSSMRYKNTSLPLKEIARELGVSAILEGSVRKVGNNVRITVQLIDAKTDMHLWSEIYDKDISNIFSIQSEVAQAIAREMKAVITPEAKQLIDKVPTSNQLAYDFYLKGKDYWAKYEIALAIDMYSKAISEDSSFVAAYAQRATMHLYSYWNKIEEWQGQDLKAKEDLNKGLILNHDLPEIKLAEAIAYYYLDRDYNKSLQILTELKTISPNMTDLYAYSSYILRRQGKWEESINEMKRAIELDPFNANYIDNLSFTYQILHQYDIEIGLYKKGLTLIPDHKFFNYNFFIAVVNKTGDLQLALKESGLKEEDVQFEFYYYTRHYKQAIEFIRKQNMVTSTQFRYTPKMYQLALIYFLSGDVSLGRIYADSAIMDLKEKIMENPSDDRYYATLGKCYALKGKVKEAISYGEKAIDLKPIKEDCYLGINKVEDFMEIYLMSGIYNTVLDKMEYLLSVPSWLSIGDLLIDPLYDNLRQLPRFQKIINSAQKQQE